MYLQVDAQKVSPQSLSVSEDEVEDEDTTISNRQTSDVMGCLLDERVCMLSDNYVSIPSATHQLNIKNIFVCFQD
jgi:hypothetical protein